MKRQCTLGLLCAVWLYAVDAPAVGTPARLIDQGHYKQVRAIAERQNRDHPNDPETLWLMSIVKLMWGDHKTAVELAEKTVAADPKNPRYRLQLAQAVGDEAQKASILRQPGLARRFKKELDTALALDPKNLEAMKLLIVYYFVAPGIMGGDKAAGRTMADQMMRIDPVEGYLAQVTVARYDKQESRIEELLRKAVEAGPASYRAHANLASFCLGPVKKYGEAEAHAREALRIDPGRAGAHGVLVMSLIAQDKWTELDAALAETDKDIPDDLSPYFRAGLSCLAKPGELARAERYFRRYLTQEPEPNTASHSRARWRLGQTLEKENRQPEAIAELQASVKLDPDSPARQ